MGRLVSDSESFLLLLVGPCCRCMSAHPCSAVPTRPRLCVDPSACARCLCPHIATWCHGQGTDPELALARLSSIELSRYSMRCGQGIRRCGLEPAGPSSVLYQLCDSGGPCYPPDAWNSSSVEGRWVSVLKSNRRNVCKREGLRVHVTRAWPRTC